MILASDELRLHADTVHKLDVFVAWLTKCRWCVYSVMVRASAELRIHDDSVHKLDVFIPWFNNWRLGEVRYDSAL